MPQLSQGDIFQAASRVQVAIVFGHVGFNQMRHHWAIFAATQDKLSHVNDPFTELAERAFEWSPGRWLWFIAEERNHGMTDTQVTRALDTAFSWMSQMGLTSAATNGIANTDHGHNTTDNRRSDEQRAILLKDYADQAEQRYCLSIELISLNDIFMR